MKNIFRKSVAMFIAIMMIVTSVPFSSAVTAQAEIARYTIGTKSKGVFTNGSNRWKGNNTVNIVNDSTNDAFSIGFINFDISDVPNIDDSYAVKSNYTFDLQKLSGCKEFIPLHISYPTQNQSLFYNQSTPTGTDTPGNNLSRIDSTAFNAIYKSGYHDNAVDYFGLKDLRVCRANSDYSRSTVTIDIGVAIKNAKMAGLNYATVVFMLAWGGNSGESGGWSDTLVYFGDDSIEVALKKATKTKTINVSQFEQTNFSDGTKDGFGILKSTAGNSRLKDDKRLVIVNDAQNDNFDIGYVTFDVSELAGQNVKLSHAYYTFNTQRDHNEDLGIKLFYPTLNEDTFYRAGEWTDGSTAIWPESGGNNNYDSNTVTWDHMREAKRYFGFVEIDTIPSISSSVTSQTIDIYRAIQWAINNGRSTAVVCFMIAKHGGVGAKDLNGNGNNWSDVHVTITNKSVDINYASDATKEKQIIIDNIANGAPSYNTTIDVSGNTISNQADYMKGIVVSGSYGQRSADVINDFFGKDSNRITFKFHALDSLVAVYDGSEIRIPVISQTTDGGTQATGTGYVGIDHMSLKNGGQFSLGDGTWRRCSSWTNFGNDSDTSYDFSSDISTNIVRPIDTGNDRFDVKNGRSWKNYITYTPDDSFNNDYYATMSNLAFNIQADFTLTYWDWGNKWGSRSDYVRETNADVNYKIINYMPLKNLMDSQNLKDTFNQVSNNESLYVYSTVEDYYIALSALYQFNLTDGLTVDNVADKAASMKLLISNYNTAKSNLQYRFVFRHYDGDTETVAAKAYDDFNSSYNEALAKLKVRQSAPTYSIIDGNNTQHNKTTYSWQRGANIVTYSEIGSTSPEGHDIEYTPSTIYKHTVICTKCDLNDTADHEFGEDGICTNCGFHEVDEDAYNAAVIVLESELAKTDVYTAESIAAVQAVLDKAKADKENCQSQSALEVITQSVVEAKTYLVKKTITITFKKEIGDNVTIETINSEYGKEITIDSGITDANITKWTAETDDGTSAMHTSMSSVTYVPYADVTITVYADSKETSAVNTKKVVFRTLNGSVQEVRYVENFDDVKSDMPAGKAYSFYTFAGWSQPKYSDTDTVYYDAVYEFKGSEADQCGIHFTYKNEIKQYEYDSFVKLDGLDSSKTYALSTTADENGIITYLRGNAFYAPHAEDVYVVECTGEPLPMIGITGDYNVTNTDKRGIAVNSKYYLPDGAVRVEAGFDVVMVKTTDERSSVTRVKCPNVNAYGEFLKTFTTKNPLIAAFEITPYVIYTLDGDQIELKGSTKTYNL